MIDKTEPSPFSHLAPGDLVIHPSEHDWGIGQVQSIIGHRITVNFENAGKRLINGEIIELELYEPGSDR